MYELSGKSAQNQAYSNAYHDVSETVPQNLTSEVAQRLEALSAVIADTAGNLTELSDRLFGTVPRPASNANGANKVAGQASEIIATLDNLLERAGYVRGEAAQLNSRI